MLIGTLSASVPDSPVIERDSQSITSDESVGSEQSKTDRITEFHLQSGIVDKSWVLIQERVQIVALLGLRRINHCCETDLIVLP